MLLDILVRLASDPSKIGALSERGAIKLDGLALSDEEAAALKAGDCKKMRMMVAEEKANARIAGGVPLPGGVGMAPGLHVEKGRDGNSCLILR